jgi:hypothetical protein
MPKAIFKRSEAKIELCHVPSTTRATQGVPRHSYCEPASNSFERWTYDTATIHITSPVQKDIEFPLIHQAKSATYGGGEH